MMRVVLATIAATLTAAMLSACAGLPPPEARTLSSALPVTEGETTTLGRAIAPLLAEQPNGQSGFRTLPEAREAFAVRYLMIENAEKTLDVQYYIWRRDKTGMLLLYALRDAADRGVRVRLLLDDLNTGRLDGDLAALAEHPNIEIRLFNPFPVRASRTLGFIQDFNRANRRMHNKSMTADNQATIIGGRNIGDQYFAAGNGFLFNDLDVLAIGPVVNEVSEQFDAYWASLSTYPVEGIIPELDDAARLVIDQRAHARIQNDRVEDYLHTVSDTPFVHELLTGSGPQWTWAEARMVSDSPTKGLGLANGEELITHELQEAIGQPEFRVDLISPYFVPTRAGVDGLVALAEQGVEIMILTNSLEATDVALVHAGYAKWRKELLEAGIRIFETKAMVGVRELGDEPERDRSPGRFGSGASSLHAKTFSVDRKRVFIGSFNFDPRSASLNTELGFVIESRELAEEIDNAFLDRIPWRAYEVRLASSGRLYWLERREGHIQRHDIDPNTTRLKRTAVRILSFLPIDWLL